MKKYPIDEMRTSLDADRKILALLVDHRYVKNKNDILKKLSSEVQVNGPYNYFEEEKEFILNRDWSSFSFEFMRAPGGYTKLDISKD